MPKKKRTEDITILSVPRLVRNEDEHKRYWVYKDEDEFVEVEASIAIDAQEMSGVEKPYMILFKNNDMKKVFGPNELTNDGESSFSMHNLNTIRSHNITEYV